MVAIYGSSAVGSKQSGPTGKKQRFLQRSPAPHAAVKLLRSLATPLPVCMQAHIIGLLNNMGVPGIPTLWHHEPLSGGTSRLIIQPYGRPVISAGTDIHTAKYTLQVVKDVADTLIELDSRQVMVLGLGCRHQV